MSDHPVDPAVVAADDALLTRIGAGVTTNDDTTELEQLLMAWRNVSLS